MSNEQIYAALRRMEDKGTYACLCPECDDGRPILAVVTLGHMPYAQFEPCPDHPEGDWEFPVDDTIDHLLPMNWADDDEDEEEDEEEDE